MKRCPICGHEFDNHVEICPYCENLENDNSKKRKIRKTCLFLFLIFILILFLTAPIHDFIVP